MGKGELNRKERSFDRPYTVRRSDCSEDARPGSFLESSWLSCPKSQPPAEKLSAQNAWRPVSAPSNPVRTTAGRWRLCHGEPRRRAPLAPIWGFGLIQSLGRSPLRLQMVVTFGV